MKRKAIWGIIVMVLAVGAASVLWWLGNFYQGVKPAIGKPSQNISVLIGNQTDVPLTIPNGFSLQIFSDSLKKPRDLELDPNGVLVATDMSLGQILFFPDINKDGVADQAIIGASNLRNPHGLQFDCGVNGCKLFVAETPFVSSYDYNPQNFSLTNKTKLVDLPDDGGHFTRSLLITELEGKKQLLISVGSSCNVCNEEDDRRSKILISELNGNNVRTFANGLRNSVFIAHDPRTGQIWATEMGRDWLGDDLPPDEINIITEGRDYGWPNCYGNNVLDKSFNASATCEGKIAPHMLLQAHSAPLGLAFFGDNWPEEYQNNILVAQHGSWNRTTPAGYQIIRYIFNNNGEYLESENFVTGWLNEDNEALGRPVDILIDNNNIFISDDKAGVIYLLQYNK